MAGGLCTLALSRWAPWGQQHPQLYSVPVPALGTHGAALHLRALGQLRSAAPILMEQRLHTVDDVPDTVDEPVPLRLEDELVVDLQAEE